MSNRGMKWKEQNDDSINLDRLEFLDDISFLEISDFLIRVIINYHKLKSI